MKLSKILLGVVGVVVAVVAAGVIVGSTKSTSTEYDKDFHKGDAAISEDECDDDDDVEAAVSDGVMTAVCALRPIPAGSTLRLEDLTFSSVTSCEGLTFIPVGDVESITGKQVLCDIAEGDYITYEDITSPTE